MWSGNGSKQRNFTATHIDLNRPIRWKEKGGLKSTQALSPELHNKQAKIDSHKIFTVTVIGILVNRYLGIMAGTRSPVPEQETGKNTGGKNYGECHWCRRIAGHPIPNTRVMSLLLTTFSRHVKLELDNVSIIGPKDT